MDLDDLLAAAAPPVAARDGVLDEHLVDLVARAEATARPRRGTVRAVIVGSVVLGGVGLGSVAAATGLLPGWDRITTASGDSCDVAVVPSAKEERWGAPDEMPFTRYEQERTLAAAEAYLAGFDYDTVDRRDAIADWQRVEQRVRAAAEPGERQPRLVGDDLEVFAVSRAVMDLLADHLEQRGLDSAAIEVSLLADGCEL